MSWTNFDLTETLGFGGELGVFARCDILEKVVVGVFDGNFWIEDVHGR